MLSSAGPLLIVWNRVSSAISSLEERPSLDQWLPLPLHHRYT